MAEFIGFGFIILIIFFAIFILKQIFETMENKAINLPYRKKECLMTKAEKEFFSALDEIIKNRYYIIPQVKISNLASVNLKNRSDYYKYFNKIDRKTIDFVLFDKQFSPAIAIELDDNSHNNENRRYRDDFVDKVMDIIGLRIVHIKTAYSYNLEELSNLIFKQETK